MVAPGSIVWFGNELVYFPLLINKEEASLFPPDHKLFDEFSS